MSSTSGSAKRVTSCPTCEAGTKKAHQVACRDCWLLVPPALQTRIYGLFEKKRGTAEHLAAIREGLEAIRAAHSHDENHDDQNPQPPRAA